MANVRKWKVVLISDQDKALAPFYWTSSELRKYSPAMVGTFLLEWFPAAPVTFRIKEIRVSDPRD